MTCIVGWVHQDGTVHMGADSAVSNSHYIGTKAESKIFRLGEIMIGFSGSVRAMQALRHRLVMPEIGDKDIRCYMTIDFIDAVRQCFRDSGCLKKNNEVESIDAGFLVAIRGHLFDVCSDLQVAELSSPFNATGSGWLVALGAMNALNGLPLSRRPSIRRCLEMALEASSEWVPSVRGPFIFDSLPPNSQE